jgi:hypothetical protein
VRYTDPSGHKACDETDANGNCYTEDDITKGKKEAASKQGCSNPTYCENGKPKSPSGNLEDFVQKDEATNKPEPTSPETSANDPNWNKIAAGVLLVLVVLAADALIIYTLPALIEVWEVTMIMDAVGTGIPLVAALVYLHKEAFVLIRDGINGE